MDNRDPRHFRRWLVRKLAETSWVYTQDAQRSIEDIALDLGVHYTVLLEAKRLLLVKANRATAVAGLEPIKMRHDGQRSVVHRQYKVHVVTPPRIKEAWDTLRDLGGYNDSVLLRSIIHYALLRPEQPRWLGRGWPFEGKVHRCAGWRENASKDSWPWFVETRISMGAHSALRRRALASRITLRGYVRGIVLELLNGRIQAFDTITEVSQMFVAERYHTLEGVLEDRALAVQKGKS